MIVGAGDGNGGLDTQDLSIAVGDVPDGAAPVITSNGGGATAAVTVAENTLQYGLQRRDFLSEEF